MDGINGLKMKESRNRITIPYPKPLKKKKPKHPSVKKERLNGSTNKMNRTKGQQITLPKSPQSPKRPKTCTLESRIYFLHLDPKPLYPKKYSNKRSICYHRVKLQNDTFIKTSPGKINKITIRERCINNLFVTSKVSKKGITL